MSRRTAVQLLSRRVRGRAFAEALEPRQLLNGAIFQTSNTVTTSDNGGPIIGFPHVILVFWGANWGNGTAAPAAGTVQNAVGRAVHSFYLSDLSAYRGFASFGGGYIDRTVTITSSSPAASFTGANVATMLQTNINNGVLPRPNVDANYLYLVVAQNNTTSPGANGAHSYASDNQNNRFHYGWTTNNGNIDFVSNVLSHEIVEAMTDPEGDAIQVNPRNSSSWNEVADTTAQNYYAYWQGVQLQSYWLQSRQCYIVPFGSMDIDATGGAGGTITINGDQGGFATNDNITITKDSTNNRIEININNQQIAFAIGNNLSQFRSVKINAKEGADTIAIGANVDFPVTVDGGNGYDTVYYMGTEGDDNITFNGTRPSGNGFDPFFSSSIEEFDVTTFGGNDTITVNDCTRNMSLIGGSGNNIYYINSFTSGNALTIYGGSNNDNVILGYSSGNIAANITNISALRFYGNGGADQFQPYNINAAGDWTYALTPGNMTVSTSGYFLTALLDQVPSITAWGDVGNDLFTMSAGSTYSLLALGNNGNDTFDIRGGSSANLFGGYGDDQFIFGGGNLISAASNVYAYGEQGFDTMVLDDHLSTHNLPWAVYGDTGDPNTANTVFLGLNAYTYNGFEGVQVLAGNGNNQFQIKGMSAAVTLNGGGGNDSFLWQNAANVFNNGLAITTYPVMLDGGSGFNTLSLDDSATGLSFGIYDLYADRIRDKAFGVTSWADFNYDNLNSIGVTATNSADTLNVHGISSDIPAGQQVTVLLLGGNDTINVYPHDAAGNLTINGNIGIGGGSGIETLTFNDLGATNGINYSFSNPFGAGTQDVFGIGAAGLGAASDIENLVFNAGDGDDSFTLNSFMSGQSLSINGNGGSDSVNWTPATRNTVASVTAISYFGFDGGPGYDYLNFFNDNNPSAWNYYRTNTAFSPYRASGGYYLILNDPNVEVTYATGGAASDQIFVQQVRPGGTIYLDGAGGDDNYFLTNAQLTQDIQGLVGIYASAGTDSISIDDRADPIGRTVHITPSSVGATPGDDLFGPGGSLAYAGIAGALTIKLGSGADTVYAVPNPTTPLFIEGNGPAGARGGGLDSIGLAFANAVNPIFSPGAAGEGIYTFDNAAPLYYNGMEVESIDDVAPTVLASNYDYQTGSVSFQFSEDVSSTLDWSFLSTTNLTTSEVVPYYYQSVAFDYGTNTATFTFPGYGNGVLPDGNYHFELAAGLQDLYGNTVAAPASVDDFVLGGDANRDRTVDISDLAVLATNWQSSGQTFSGGDFNYDGTVDISDLAILATNWQQTLAPPPGVKTNPIRLARRMPFSRAVARVGLGASVWTDTEPVISPLQLG